MKTKPIPFGEPGYVHIPQERHYGIQISPEQLKEYQELCLSENGVEIGTQEALTELTALVCLLQAVHNHMEQHGWPEVDISPSNPGEEKGEFMPWTKIPRKFFESLPNSTNPEQLH